ncbi:MAG: hypothetical protein HYV63_16965 [Candidatus Schekmanbacteria bacterium]|nr:hypothetical protein [Candidatus Schekmanbacteria bacterium]
MGSSRANVLVRSAATAFGLAFVVGLAGPGWAQEPGSPFLLGPEVLTKETAADLAQVWTRRFETPAEQPGEYVLSLRNGDETGEHRVASATVFLNGAEVVEAADFTVLEGDVEVPISVAGDGNELVVTARGEPESRVTVAVLVHRPPVGFVWGGVLSVPWILLTDGAAAGLDALVHLKSMAPDGAPAEVVVAFFAPDGTPVFSSEPFVLANNASIGINLEELLASASSPEDPETADDPDHPAEPFAGSFSVHWLSPAPSRVQGTITWFTAGESQAAAGNIVELVAVGPIACPECAGEAGPTEKGAGRRHDIVALTRTLRLPRPTR